MLNPSKHLILLSVHLYAVRKAKQTENTQAGREVVGLVRGLLALRCRTKPASELARPAKESISQGRGQRDCLASCMPCPSPTL